MDDERAMAEALVEARRGIGRTSPNPPVGAVVLVDGEIVGRGWHRRAGGPHAEPQALADARKRVGAERLRGCSVFVTLEPCSSHGRTPPCTDALVGAGCARVVYGTDDPNPNHAGRAGELLRRRGIEVTCPVREQECRHLIRGFSQVQRSGRPWVLAKLAQGLDGRLTRPPGEGMWLTGPDARAEVQRIRAGCDAVVTSGETLRRDDPALTVRDPGLLDGREMPWRVILTRHAAALPRDRRLFRDQWSGRTLLREGGDIPAVLAGLAAEQGCCTVLLEAGGQLTGAFLDAGLVDEVIVFMAPMVTGGPVPATGGGGLGGGGLGGVKLESILYQKFGPDVMLRAMIAR